MASSTGLYIRYRITGHESRAQLFIHGALIELIGNQLDFDESRMFLQKHCRSRLQTDLLEEKNYVSRDTIRYGGSKKAFRLQMGLIRKSAHCRVLRSFIEARGK